MLLADMHIHALYGVDDGARTEEEMRAIVTKSYEEGVRVMCVTPHFHPRYFGDNREGVQTAFDGLKEYARENLPKLMLFRGNELRYDKGAPAWVNQGDCHTLNGTDYLLFDFLMDDDRDFIVDGVRDIQRSGYRPVLAHAERYTAFHKDWRTLRSMKEDGVVIQMNAGSLEGDYGRAIMKQARTLMDYGIVDVVGSDTHRPDSGRYYSLARTAETIRKKYGEAAAEALCRRNIIEILLGED